MKVLLALSGGIDSMYMANRASELFPEASFAIIHCNFSLRGNESDEDAAFVQSWAKSKGLDCYVKRFDTLGYARSKSISIEMAARELRYDFFYETAKNSGASAIAVAHNANDNAETLLLNLLRGTGSRGLRGMAETRIVGIASSPTAPRNDGGRHHDDTIKDGIATASPRNDEKSVLAMTEVILLRPLLKISREQITKYMIDNGLEWREDRTNKESFCERNVIRNEVFPLFKKINPSFISTLNDDICRFSQVDDIANDYFQALYPQLLTKKGDIDTTFLLGQKHWEYLLWRLLEDSGISGKQFTSLVSCLKDNRQIAGKHFGPVLGASNRLEIIGDKISDTTINIHHEIINRIELTNLNQGSGVLLFDADKLKLPLSIRKWKQGDWFIPLGMKGRKKVSDFLTSLHLSLNEKKVIFVIEYPNSEDKSHIAAVLYYRIDDSLKVTNKTNNVLKITQL